MSAIINIEKFKFPSLQEQMYTEPRVSILIPEIISPIPTKVQSFTYKKTIDEIVKCSGTNNEIFIGSIFKDPNGNLKSSVRKAILDYKELLFEKEIEFEYAGDAEVDALLYTVSEIRNNVMLDSLTEHGHGGVFPGYAGVFEITYYMFTINLKDNKTMDFYFPNRIVAEKALNKLIAEINDFYLNYKDYVANVCLSK